jgi:hypothetical protein
VHFHEDYDARGCLIELLVSSSLVTGGALWSLTAAAGTQKYIPSVAGNMTSTSGSAVRADVVVSSRPLLIK